MGRKKSTALIENNKEASKTYLQTTENAGRKTVKSKTSKSAFKHKREFHNDYDVDSLEFLKNTTKKKNLDGIDEKIKLLKTELKALLGDRAIDKSNNCEKVTNASTNNNFNEEPNINNLKPLILESDLVEAKENCTDINKSLNEKEDFELSKSLEPLEHAEKENTFPENSEKILSSESHTGAQIKSNILNVFSLTQHDIEKLLYKSFVIQNCPSDFYESVKCDSEIKNPATKVRKKKFRKSLKDSNEKHFQQKLNKYFKSNQGRRKRRRTDTKSSDVEVVNIENCSLSSLKSDNDVNLVDLDIEDYDWNEPFDVDSTEFSSESEIPESCEKIKPAVNEEVKSSDNDDLIKSKEDSFINENDKSQLNGGTWECPVCFEKSKGQEVVATQCGHVFCKKCLENHFAKLNKNCPSCRASLKNKPYITLFNF